MIEETYGAVETITETITESIVKTECETSEMATYKSMMHAITMIASEARIEPGNVFCTELHKDKGI